MLEHLQSSPKIITKKSRSRGTVIYLHPRKLRELDRVSQYDMIINAIINLPEDYRLALPEQVIKHWRLVPGYAQHRHIKKESVVTVKRYDSLDDEEKKRMIAQMRQGKNPLADLIDDALRKISYKKPVVGLDIQGANSTEQLFRIIRFYDIIRAHEAFKELTEHGDDLEKKVKFYTGDNKTNSKTTEMMYIQGSHADAIVPSFSDENDPHPLVIQGLCMRRLDDRLTDERAYDLLKHAFNLDPGECCEGVKHFENHNGRYQHSDIPGKVVYDRKGKDMLIDHHGLLGVLIINAVAQKHGLQLLATPCIPVSEKTMQFVHNLTRVYQQYSTFPTNPETGKKEREFVYKSLTDTFRNEWLARYVAYRNLHKESFNSPL